MGATTVKMTATGLHVPDEVIVPYIEGDGIGLIFGVRVDV